MKGLSLRLFASLFGVLLVCFCITDSFARGGGGGGHSSGGSHSSGSHSSGGGYHGGGGVYYGGGNRGGGGSTDGGTVLFVIILVVVILVVVAKYGKKFAPKKELEPSRVAFPEGLDAQKVSTAFMGVQAAWQAQDLKEIRKWLSDGVYQRYNAQFKMMDKLDQVNLLSNIRINGINVTKTSTDGNYQTTDVGISFTIDDEFISKRYPSFNERYQGDSDIEYWTFIKRKDAQVGDMYSTGNCPNCASPFKTEIGEISRCQNCGTLTNTANYDWVLSEITQDEDYEPVTGLEADAQLLELTKNDKYFAVQRMEDIASNVFMQIMQVLSGEKEQRLYRFANRDAIATVLQVRKNMGNFVFNRLYLNNVTLAGYRTDNDQLDLVFNITVNFQRVRAEENITLLDREISTYRWSLILSKKLTALRTPDKETVYSYECPNCAAPYPDTIVDVCPSCGTAVADLDHSWVLTHFDAGTWM